MAVVKIRENPNFLYISERVSLHSQWIAACKDFFFFFLLRFVMFLDKLLFVFSHHEYANKT